MLLVLNELKYSLQAMETKMIPCFQWAEDCDPHRPVNKSRSAGLSSEKRNNQEIFELIMQLPDRIMAA